MGKRQYEDDDGRIIADMSELERPSVVSDWISRRGRERLSSYGSSEELDRKERGAAIRGALGASLLIGGIYLAVFALLIAGLLFLWGVL